MIASIGVLYNIAIPEEDPYEIDGFENYYGVDSMLTNYWAVNKDTGCTINLALTAEKGQVFDGKYATDGRELRFQRKLTGLTVMHFNSIQYRMENIRK